MNCHSANDCTGVHASIVPQQPQGWARRCYHTTALTGNHTEWCFCYISHISHFVDNKAKGRISKRVFQENKASRIFRKTNIFYSLISTPENLFILGKVHHYWAYMHWILSRPAAEKALVLVRGISYSHVTHLKVPRTQELLSLSCNKTTQYRSAIFLHIEGLYIYKSPEITTVWTRVEKSLFESISVLTSLWGGANDARVFPFWLSCD